MNLPFENFDDLVGICQNIFRRAYFGVREESAATQERVLGIICETAILSMDYDAHFQSTYHTHRAKIVANVNELEAFLRRKNLWGRGLPQKPHERLISSRINHEDIYRARLSAKMQSTLTGKDSLNLTADLGRQTEEMFKDYRQRWWVLRKGGFPPAEALVVGVVTCGVYYGATVYHALQTTPENFALVKKSVHDRGVHVFPAEEARIRRALQQGRPVIVADDVAQSCGSFFAISDYFRNPPTMYFSANLYFSPLPRELHIVERSLLRQIQGRPDQLRFADNALKISFLSLLQYDTLDRDARECLVLPPVVNFS